MSNTTYDPSDIDVDQIVEDAFKNVDGEELEDSFRTFGEEAKQAFEDAVRREKIRDIKINTGLALGAIAVVGVAPLL